MIKIVAAFCVALAVLVVSQTAEDFHVYHWLHLPHRPSLHPTLYRAPGVGQCGRRARGYYADVGTGCQAYFYCARQQLVSTELCANGTLFNEQFQVCDHFYNVRCGSPYEDL